jgi:hypothetical protein
MWKTDRSDVYVAGRTFGGSMKVSLHESGSCHVRAPDARHWSGNGVPPRYLEEWQIDVKSNHQVPFSVVIPAAELRGGKWPQLREKNTVWVDSPPEGAVQVAVFLVRAEGDLSAQFGAVGWTTCITDTPLPDGRRLLVLAGPATIPPERGRELAAVKASARAANAGIPKPVGNLRMVLVTGANEHGTRAFVEAAVL